MKESGKDRLKCAINESTLSTADAVPLPQWGRQRGSGFAAKKRKPTPSRCARQPLPREGASMDTSSFLWKEVPRRGGGWMRKALSPTQSLPHVGKVASGASRIGFWRYEKERGNASQVEDKREHPIHRCAVPLPQWGRQRNEDTAFLDTKPSPRGEGGERSEPDRVLAV